MTQFEFIRPHSGSGMLTLTDAAQIGDSLRRGSLAVLPTETGYMLAAVATSIPAIELAFAVKERNHAQVMHVACASLAMASSIGQLSPLAMRLLGEFTPGPVSVIVPKTRVLPDRLVTVDGTVGIRIPDHPATLQVINEVAAPLTATSLNISGTAPVPVKELDLHSLNWPADDTVYVVEDDDSISYGTGSTLIGLSGGQVDVLRAGPVPEKVIRAVAGTPGYLETAARC
ncbi:MAG TPA: L-threonylcarbamoyladenylate synthase [Streptosporangiaceae bacterium]|nr:L-threonylcarbamoyladenylate synthase [Streptosporangiaceae bacterium]